MQDDFRPNRRPTTPPPRLTGRMNDIRKSPAPDMQNNSPSSLPRPVSAVQPAASNARPADQSSQIDMNLPEKTQEAKTLKKPKKAWKIWLAAGILGILLLILGVCYAWYSYQLSPVDSSNTERKLVTISSGTTANYIAKQLKNEGLVRSDDVFNIYTRLSGTRDILKAGVYRLSPSESTPQIVDHLIQGKTDSMNITFFPGATLTDNSDKPIAKKTDVTSVLKKAGYQDEEIKAALVKTYSHPVFADKPASTSLEGYIYGETYSVNSGATVEDILNRTFDQLYKVIKDKNLIEGFKSHGLNLYEGITLASIVEREVSNHEDRRQAAQVFYSRLASDTVLGSDVTFIYGANLLGVSPSVGLDSPYNTRKIKGLPPGPIASPSESSLLAVADPAPGDYMYFVAGDDGKTYFSRTEAEHEALAAKHCIKLCSEF